MKSQIIERLGQTDILMPSLIAEGLAANDRVKARLSVLQAAGRHARGPRGVRFDLANECRAVGIDPVAMETLVNGASPLAGERITAPGLGNLGTAIWDDVATMVRAVKAGDAAQGDIALERLSAIKGAASPATATACIAWSWICTRPSIVCPRLMRKKCWQVRMSMGCCRRTGLRSRRSCAGSNQPVS